MNDFAIRVVDLSKRYRIGVRRRHNYRTLRETLAEITSAPWRKLRGDRNRKNEIEPKPPNTIWALRDISFTVNRGDVLGLIGRNGAGKSTLLKVLSRITEPTSGYAEIQGRIGSLLEVGTGFHPELTGRENIYLSGALLGMRRAEIMRRFDEIVAFAEVDTFIDTPVKRYSSGMYLRLAFAVAAHLETEILLVDEVLAVGDVSFRRKCLGKMQEVGEGGRTVIFVSHDMTAISRLAQNSVFLDQGQIQFIGETEEAIRRYISQPTGEDLDLRTRLDRKGDGAVRFDHLRIFNDHGEETNCISSGSPVRFAVEFHTGLKNIRIEDLMLEIRIGDLMGHPITTFSTRFVRPAGDGYIADRCLLHCEVPSLPLAEDTYILDLWVGYRGALADYVTRVRELTVLTSDYFGSGYAPLKRKHGASLFPHHWTFEPGAIEQPSGVSTREAG